MDAYKTARRNKRRSADSVDYELHAERNLSRLYDALCDRSLTPSAYTFVTMKPRPREVFACEMGMRIIHHYIDIRMRPLIEARLKERTFNHRLGSGPDEAVNQLAEDIFTEIHRAKSGLKVAFVTLITLSDPIVHVIGAELCRPALSVHRERYRSGPRLRSRIGRGTVRGDRSLSKVYVFKSVLNFISH